MTDTAPSTLREPGPPPPRPPRDEAPFFSWLRALRVVREPGWLGGVCAGVATRIGIDPVIVRGVFVVTALIGFPALIVYALGWALLPDADGRIHVQEWGRGRFDPALIAIATMVLLGCLPVMQWLWSSVFWPYTGIPAGWGPEPSAMYAVWNGIAIALLVAAVVALAVWFIVWAVRYPAGTRRGRVGAEASGLTASPAPGDDAATALGEGSATEGAGEARPTDVAPVEPPPPDAAAPEDALAQWRATHERWRTEHEAWRRSQAAADVAAREQERLERAAASRAFAAEVAERRRVRRATNPRAHAMFVLAVLGAALVGGALCALALDEPALAVSAGLLVAGLVASAGMIVAGLARRRSGFLALCAATLVLSGAVSGLAGATGPVAWGGLMIAQVGSSDQRYLQPFGTTEIHVFDVTADSSGRVNEDAGRVVAGEIALRKGSGDTTIWVQPGTMLQLDATLHDGPVDVVRHDDRTGDWLSTETLVPTEGRSSGAHYAQRLTGSEGPDFVGTVVPLHLEQNSGTVTVIVQMTGEE
ncbi:PspC domain-containing protein [Microbacterium sp. RD1]|uniref:PspC domain-containing protein n=1 Tax=Microbacterium sp. RD1 TaxID=3457313 RepID=UPI003FA532F9